MDWQHWSPPATHLQCKPQTASSEIHPVPRLSLPSQPQVTLMLTKVLMSRRLDLSIRSWKRPQFSPLRSPSLRWTRRSTSLSSLTSLSLWICPFPLVPSSRSPSQRRSPYSMTMALYSWLEHQVNRPCFRVPLCRLLTRWPRRSRFPT